MTDEIRLGMTPSRPTVWVNGLETEWELASEPVYPRSRLKRLWWRIRGIQPTKFHEYVRVKEIPSYGDSVVFFYEADDL